MMAVKSFLLLLLFVISSSGYGTPTQKIRVRDHSLSRRSAHLNERLLELQKRQATSWYSNRTSCSGLNFTQFDVLGRRQSGLLHTPGDQGDCGSCWAFSAAHAFTDYRSIVAGQSTSLISPQHLSTCYNETNFLWLVNNGCCGGRLDAGPRYFQQTGAVTDMCMPYDLEDHPLDTWYPLQCQGMCADNSIYDPSMLRLHSYENLASEADVVAALQNGPVLAGMITFDEDFYNYECGVFTTARRTLINIGHAVEIVDYGTTDTGIQFYVVKNSWGINWGEDGYFRIRRGDLGIGNGPVNLVVEEDSRYSIIPNQRLGVVNLVLSSQGGAVTSRQTSYFNSSSCSPSTVANLADPLVVEAATYAVDELIRLAAIRCPDGSAANQITIDSIMNATAQTVAGTVFTLTIDAQATGCSSAFDAIILVEVLLDTEDSYMLSSYTYTVENPMSRPTIVTPSTGVTPTTPSTGVMPTTQNTGETPTPILAMLLLIGSAVLAANIL